MHYIQSMEALAVLDVQILPDIAYTPDQAVQSRNASFLNLLIL